MRFVNVLLALLVSLAIGLGILEVGLRLLGLGPTPTLNRFDAVTGWGNVPGRDVRRKHPDAKEKLHFAMNRFGMRDDDVDSPAKPSGVFRVLALGDSFTLGFGVQREDTFVDLLERHWNAEGRRVEIWNVGTEGFSTDQEVAWLAANGAAWQPDLVLVFPYENDLYWNGETAYIGGKQKPRYSTAGRLEPRELVEVGKKTWRSRFALTKWMEKKPDSSAHYFVPAGGTRPVLKELAAVLTTPPPFLETAQLHTKGALAALEDECAKLSARLLVVPIPGHSAVDDVFRANFTRTALGGLRSDLWSPDVPVDFFLDACRELGIDAADVREGLRAEHAAGRKLYWERDWHLDPGGNRVFARLVDSALGERGALPPGGSELAFTEEAAAAPARAGLPAWLPLFGGLWALLSILYLATYKDEPRWQPPLKIAALLTVIFAMVIGLKAAVAVLPPVLGKLMIVCFVLVVLGFVAYKLGNRLGTIGELLKSFTLRGHWYLMPLVVVLVSVGSLLVVAASSPLIAPFIYTLF